MNKIKVRSEKFRRFNSDEYYYSATCFGHWVYLSSYKPIDKRKVKKLLTKKARKVRDNFNSSGTFEKLLSRGLYKCRKPLQFLSAANADYKKPTGVINIPTEVEATEEQARQIRTAIDKLNSIPVPSENRLFRGLPFRVWPHSFNSSDMQTLNNNATINRMKKLEGVDFSIAIQAFRKFSEACKKGILGK